MTTQRITTASRFEAQFGFCRGLRRGNQISVAGTAPIGPDGETVGVGDPAAQARRCFDIISETIDALGGSLEHTIRTRMFLTNINDWQAIGAVHGEYFGEIQPVATMVAVEALIDPQWLVEIEADALID